MKNLILKTLTLAMSLIWLASCNMDGLKSNSDSTTPATPVVLTNVAQTSSQLASGTSFTLSGSSSDSGGMHPEGMGGRKGPGGPGMIDGTGLFTATDELLAIVDAESAGDFRGFRMQAAGGATVTN